MRASILAHTMQGMGPPAVGSPRESVLSLYLQTIAQIDYARDLAHAQLVIDQKTGIKRFIEFQHIKFPWLESAQLKENMDNYKILDRWVKDGPLAITRMQDYTARRRTNVRRVQAPPTTPVNQQALSRINQKLRRTIPV